MFCIVPFFLEVAGVRRTFNFTAERARKLPYNTDGVMRPYKPPRSSFRFTFEGLGDKIQFRLRIVNHQLNRIGPDG